MTGILTKDQIDNILKSQSIGRLACADGKHPYVVPITYYYDGDAIICQSQEGKKIKILRKNPHVCFQVDLVTSMNNWQSIQAFGTYEELDEEKAEKAREKLFGNVFTLMTEARSHHFEHDLADKIDDSNRIKHVMFKIKIREVAGRFEKQ